MKKIILCALLASTTFAKFTNETEASLVNTSGNTDLKTYSMKFKSAYTLPVYTTSFALNYTYGESNDIRSNEKWDTTLKVEKKLTNKFSVFGSETVEANRFANIKRRYNTDIGGKQTLKSSKTNTTFVELGYRYTIEQNTDESLEDKKSSKGRLYIESKQKLSETSFVNLWVEYIPDFRESEDYLVNIGPSLSVTVNSFLSLKTSYIINYDNLPEEGNTKYDRTMTTGLIANF